MAIDRWVILISGFTQSEGRPRGMDSLWLRLRECSGPRTAVQILPWRHRWEEFAEFVFRMRPHPEDGVRPPEGEVDIRIAAYSWGAGHGFVTLAEELRRCGLAVRKAVLCDPVYHCLYAPWRAVFSPIVTPRIVVPGNVREVWSLRQRLNKPCGHDVVAAKPSETFIHDPYELNCGHEYADDASLFHEVTLREFCPKRTR